MQAPVPVLASIAFMQPFDLPLLVGTMGLLPSVSMPSLALSPVLQAQPLDAMSELLHHVIAPKFNTTCIVELVTCFHMFRK